MAAGFDLTLTRRTLLGDGSITELGPIAAGFGTRALLMIGRGSVRASGAFDGALASLAAAGIISHLFEGVEPDPSVDTTDRAADLCRGLEAQLVISLGGGSVMDCAKSVAMLATNPGSSAEYQLGQRTVEVAGVAHIAIPTTAGTGSEANRISVLTHHGERMKKSIADRRMVPDVAILDPSLTTSLPPFETAYTGVDAFAHAAEAYVSLNATPVTEAFSLRAIELVAKSLVRAVDAGDDVEARADMLLASYLGGASLNAGVGCAHMLAHPLGASFGMPHGAAIAGLLPQVLDANWEHAPDKYARIARALDPELASATTAQAAGSAADALRGLLERIGLKVRLGDHGVSPDCFGTIYSGVQKSTGHIKTNPRPVDPELLRAIIETSI